VSTVDWIKAGIDIFSAVFSGVIIALAVYLLDERRAKREQQLSDYRIASNWSQNEPKVSLRGFDLQQRNLSSCKFIGANLEETIFTQSKMWATNFNEANLRLTNFSRTELVGCKFIKAVVIRGNFSGATIKARTDPDYTYTPDFSNATLVFVKFKNARISGANFTNTKLKGSDFSGAIVQECDFSGADLTKTNWRRVKLVENCVWKDVQVDNQANFPPFLWKEIQSQNTTLNQ
jgi:uncharacterized protein YjbI with pentapeptide repeats